MPPSWRLMMAVCLVCVGVVLAPARAEDAVGVRTLAVTVPERGEAIDLTVWYPVKTGGRDEPVGATAIFAGTPARRNAEMADGAFPIVLLAHGGLRSAPHLGGWIAAHLAARGRIVAVVPPPRLGPGDAHAAVRELWLRPADLSAALSAVLGDPAMTRHAAPEKVGAVGFFLGGTSVLTLAGARVDGDRYRESCDHPGQGVDCAWFARNGVDLRRIDDRLVTASHLDPRIGGVVAVDPEFSRSFTATSLADVKIPVAILNLGRAGGVAPAFDAANLETAIPGARFHRIADATRFSAFNACTARGAALLREGGEDDALCLDEGPSPRRDLQKEIAAIIDAALEEVFFRSP